MEYVLEHKINGRKSLNALIIFFHSGGYYDTPGIQSIGGIKILSFP